MITTYPIGGARGLAEGALGRVFTASNPTPGTGIIGHAAPTTFDSTKPYLLVYNTGSTTNPNNTTVIIPLYLRLTLTVASVASTSMRFTQVVDPVLATTIATGKLGATRYSSGGTQLAAANTNSIAANGSAANVYAGAVVAVASSANARMVSNQTFRTVIGVVGDVYQLSWGAPEQIDPASLITTGTAVANVAFGFAPIVLYPGHSFTIHQWSASQSTGPTFEVEFCWYEMPVE